MEYDSLSSEDLTNSQSAPDFHLSSDEATSSQSLYGSQGQSSQVLKHLLVNFFH